MELVPSHLKIQLLSADIYCDKQQDTHVCLSDFGMKIMSFKVFTIYIQWTLEKAKKITVTVLLEETMCSLHAVTEQV